MTQYLYGESRADLIAQASNRYAAGLTIRQVGVELGYSYSATRNMLVRAGVKLRPRPGERRTEPSQQKHGGGPRRAANPASAATSDRRAA